MCLHNISLNLTTHRNGEYIGIGYKLMRPGEIGKMKIWQKAENKYSINRNEMIYTDDYERYFPGFHIFLNEKDARNYCINKVNRCLYKVEFKIVKSFGTNATNDDNGYKTVYAPCVIADYIRYVEVLEKF